MSHKIMSTIINFSFFSSFSSWNLIRNNFRHCYSCVPLREQTSLVDWNVSKQDYDETNHQSKTAGVWSPKHLEKCISHTLEINQEFGEEGQKASEVKMWAELAVNKFPQDSWLTQSAWAETCLFEPCGPSTCFCWLNILDLEADARGEGYSLVNNKTQRSPTPLHQGLEHGRSNKKTLNPWEIHSLVTGGNGPEKRPAHPPWVMFTHQMFGTAQD